MLRTQKRAESIICSYLKKAFHCGYNVKGLQWIQEGMLHQLFHLHHAIYTDTEGETMILTLTGGNLKRHTKMLIGSLPVIGGIVWGGAVAAMAVASTYALAQVAMVCFAVQRPFAELSGKAVRAVYRQAFEHGKEIAATIEKQPYRSFLMPIDFRAAEELYRRICEEDEANARAARRNTSQKTSSAKQTAELIEKLKHLCTQSAPLPKRTFKLRNKNS